MDNPIVNISYRKYYADSVTVGAEIRYPGDLLIVFPNSEYFFKTGNCRCRKIISKENGSPITEKSNFEGKGRKCSLYGNMCDLFTDELLDQIKAEREHSMRAKP